MRGRINILEKEALTFEELVIHFGTMHIEDVSKEEFTKFSRLSGEEVLPGFELDLELFMLRK